MFFELKHSISRWTMAFVAAVIMSYGGVFHSARAEEGRDYQVVQQERVFYYQEDKETPTIDVVMQVLKDHPGYELEKVERVGQYRTYSSGVAVLEGTLIYIRKIAPLEPEAP